MGGHAMAGGRPKPVLQLGDDERRTLEAYTRRRKISQQLALRARIVLLCASGMDNQDVAARLQIRAVTVGKWRTKLVQRRLDGLFDEPRSGAPRTVSDATVERVITTTLEATPRNATHWSTREMAKHVGLSQTTISRIWRAFNVQPHRIETFRLSNLSPTRNDVAVRGARHGDGSGARQVLSPTPFARVPGLPGFPRILASGCTSRRRTRRGSTWPSASSPFIWTESAEQILDTVARYCQRTLLVHAPEVLKRTSGSGHEQPVEQLSASESRTSRPKGSALRRPSSMKRASRPSIGAIRRASHRGARAAAVASARSAAAAPWSARDVPIPNSACISLERFCPTMRSV